MSFFITIFQKNRFSKKNKNFSIAEGSIVGSKAPKGDIKMARYREVFYSLSPVVTSVSIVAPVGITVISTIITSIIGLGRSFGFGFGFSFRFGISGPLSEVTVSVSVGVSVVSA